jgi:hypothetical protein
MRISKSVYRGRCNIAVQGFSSRSLLTSQKDVFHEGRQGKQLSFGELLVSSLNIRCPTELYSCSSAADRRCYRWYAGCLLDHSRRLCQDSTSSRATSWCHSLQGSHRRSDYHPQGRGLPSPFQGRYRPSHPIESPIRSVSGRRASSGLVRPI